MVRPGHHGRFGIFALAVRAAYSHWALGGFWRAYPGEFYAADLVRIFAVSCRGVKPMGSFQLAESVSLSSGYLMAVVDTGLVLF